MKLIVTNPMRQNKMLNAEQAHELGLVDRVIELERLIDEAITIARRAADPRAAADLSSTSERHGARPEPARRFAARRRAGALPRART